MLRSALPPKCVLVLVIVSAPTHAQSFNINIGPSGTVIPDDYAAAGLPGHWMSIPAYHNSNTYDLVDIRGNVSGVHVWQYGGTELKTEDDPATLGADGLLMDTCQVTYTSNLETCLFFYDLQPGAYEVLIYSWMPNRPDVLSYASADEEPGQPHAIVGGAWPGGHQELVTYSRHMCQVTTGLLRTHSGIVPGHPPADGAAFNAIQIRHIVPCPGDVDGDGLVGQPDLGLLLAHWEQSVPPNTDGDLNGDGQVDQSDLGILLANWGSVCG